MTKPAKRAAGRSATFGFRVFDRILHTNAANISFPLDPLGVIPKDNFGPRRITCATIRHPKASKSLDHSDIHVHSLTIMVSTWSQMSSSHAARLFEGEVV
jgi:hypothetical protein